MKKTLLITALFAVSLVGCNKEEKSERVPAEQEIEKITQNTDAELSITPEQKEELDKIAESLEKELQY